MLPDKGPRTASPAATCRSSHQQPEHGFRAADSSLPARGWQLSWICPYWNVCVTVCCGSTLNNEPGGNDHEAFAAHRHAGQLLLLPYLRERGRPQGIDPDHGAVQPALRALLRVLR